MRNRTAATNAALTTWFGANILTNSNKIEKLQRAIQIMRTYLNRWNVTITYMGPDAQKNARAWPPTEDDPLVAHDPRVIYSIE